MLRPMVLAVILMGAAGCRHAQPSAPAVILGGTWSQEPCIERVLRRIRAAGYVEQTGDRVAGFVRVAYFVQARHGHRAPGGFFQIQCSPDHSSATVVVGGWPYPEPLPRGVQKQLDAFTSLLASF